MQFWYMQDVKQVIWVKIEAFYENVMETLNIYIYTLKSSGMKQSLYMCISH